MSRPYLRFAGSCLLVAMTVGCHSVHSRAVRDLIQAESGKIDAAQTNVDAFQKQTAERIKVLEQARVMLHESFKALQMQHAKHQSMLASYSTLTSQPGEPAYAAAHSVGLQYLADYQGLEKRIRDQFEEDFSALRDTADALNHSWKDIATLHAEVSRFAAKTALASVDPQLVSAIIQQSPRQSDRILRVLDNSRMVNDALEEIVGTGIFRARVLGQAHSFTADVVDLLDKLNKDDR